MVPVTKNQTQKKTFGCSIIYLIFGLLSALLGILSIVYDFQELVLDERIKVRPGFPPYEMWRSPSKDIDVGVTVFIFAVENPTEFLSNPTAKLKLKEIGPIIYKKILRQDNIVFHDENSTISYSTYYDLVFDEERNELGILNQSITIVNPMLLGLAAMSHDIFFARMAFNVMAASDHVFLNRTIYEILWENTSPIFDSVKKIPFAVSRQNAGIMFNAFFQMHIRYNVNAGPKHGYENFFKINTLNGISRIDVYKENFPEHCPFSLKGATEGSGLPPQMGKNYVIYAYTPGLCRTYPMVYNSTINVDGIEAYKYVFADNIFTRLEDPDLDCFKQTGTVVLPNGLTDSSKCAWGLPIAISNPQFWGYHGDWENYLEGLRPNEKNHSSFIIAEPKSGIQLSGIARLQSNLVMPRLDYFTPDIRRFSEMILPQFWMEYFMTNKDPVIHGMMVTFLKLPVIQIIFTTVMLALSLFFIYKHYRLTTILAKTINSFEEQEILFEGENVCPTK